MTLATATATRAELNTLYAAVHTLQVMLREVYQSNASGTSPNYGRFTAAQIDAQISAVTAAITAVNA